MPLFVNQELVDEAVLRAEERAIRPRLQEAMAGESLAAVEARVREWARENVIERVVLRQAAWADAEPVTPAQVDQAIAGLDPTTPRHEIEERLRVDRLFSRVTANLAPPRNKDVTEYYRKNRENLQAPERVHAAHIIKNLDERTDESTAQADIEEIERELKSGAKFEELADKRSDCSGNAGDLGIFARGQMVPEFDAVVFGMNSGEVSPVFRTQFGFHIAKVYERWPEGVQELSEIRPQIEKLLFEQKKQRAIEQYLDRLISRAEIRTEINGA